MGKHSQTDHVLTDKTQPSGIINVQSFRGCNCDTIFWWLQKLHRDCW